MAETEGIVRFQLGRHKDWQNNSPIAPRDLGIRVIRQYMKLFRNDFLPASKHPRGLLYRSTGQNINGPNINELQINCSIGQQKPVDV